MELQLSEGERQALSDAGEFDKLASFKGWHLALKFLSDRAEIAESRRDGNLSGDTLIAWQLQMIARERRAALESLKQHVAEIRTSRKNILAEIFKVDLDQIDAAMQEEIELTLAAKGM